MRAESPQTPIEEGHSASMGITARYRSRTFGQTTDLHFSDTNLKIAMRHTDIISFDSLPGIQGDNLDFVLDSFAARAAARRMIEGIGSIPTMTELLAACRLPQSIAEFSGFASLHNLLHGVVIRAPDTSFLGFCYRGDVYDQLENEGIHYLIAMRRPRDGEAQLSVAELFAHELAHVAAGEGHGLVFLCICQAIRASAGLPPSRDPYDAIELEDDWSTVAGDIDSFTWSAAVGAGLAGNRLLQTRSSLVASELRDALGHDRSSGTVFDLAHADLLVRRVTSRLL